MAPRWLMYRRLLLRRAGFGVELMTGLGDARVSAAARTYRDRVADVDATRDALLRTDLPERVAEAAAADDRALLRAWSAVRSAVGRRRPLPTGAVAGLGATPRRLADYDASLAAEHTAGQALDRALDEETAERGARLAAVLSDPRVQDALAQLTPSFYGQVRRWLAAPPGRPTAKERAFLRRAYLYCQRLGGKNETTSFFGPLVHGRVDRDATGVTLGAETATGIRAVRAQVSFWAVRALARAMAADPAVAPRVAPTWVPAARREENRLVLADGTAVTLTVAQSRLAAAVNGARDRAELASLAGMSPDAATRFVERLARAGAVRTWPEPPSTAPDPLDVLVRDADRLAHDTAWPRRLRELASHAHGYAAADDAPARLAAQERAEELFTRLTGLSPRRAGGRVYADRGVVSMDAEGDHAPFTVGADVADRWERALGPVLDVAAHYGRLYRDAHRALCADVLASTGPLPYDELIRRVEDAVAEGRLAHHLAPVEKFAARFTEAVLLHTEHGRAHVPVETLDRLTGVVDGPLFASPDLMLERRPDGGTTLVLGELHPYVYAWGSQGLFSEDDPGLLEEFRADLSAWGGERRMATVLRLRQHKGLLADWFPGRFVEVTALASRDRSRTLAVTDLTAALENGVPRLHDRTGEVVLYSGGEDHPHLTAFSAPAPMLPLVRDGAAAPRVSVDDVIVQRARWWVDAADLGAGPGTDTAAAFRAAQCLRARRGLPRHVFAQVPGEPKPIGVDLDAPVAVEALTRLAAARSAPEISLSEMRPAPDRLWLTHHGRPTTSEFRLALRKEATS